MWQPPINWEKSVAEINTEITNPKSKKEKYQYLKTDVLSNSEDDSDLDSDEIIIRKKKPVTKSKPVINNMFGEDNDSSPTEPVRLSKSPKKIQKETKKK